MRRPPTFKQLEQALEKFQDAEAKLRGANHRLSRARRHEQKDQLEERRREWEDARVIREWAAIDFVRLFLRVVPRDPKKAAVVIAQRELEPQLQALAAVTAAARKHLGGRHD